MEKFVNSTFSQKEKAIKIGNNVPSGSVGLSWFSTKEISPANNIIQIDLSETILENRSLSNSSDNEAFLAFADELGFLKTVDGNYSFSNDDITISNLFLNKATSTELVDINSINVNEFVHYFYVSKNFIIAPAVFSFYSISQYDDPNNFKDLNIKVINSDGFDYVDKNTGRKKYRFLLEPFKTSTNYLRTEIPYRLVVLLDADEPLNLKLVYDKVECDSLGNTFSLQLNYQEPINAVEYFQDIPEESFVIDSNYKDKRNFSIKKINQKYSDLISTTGSLNGYQIVTPSKAIDDNRNFEIFNWRLIARTINRINFNEIEEEKLVQGFEKAIIKTIKVGVINDSSSNVLTNPYIFNRLNISPFNLAGYQFINPLKETNTNINFGQSMDKNLAAYWQVDIDSVNNFNDFDVLFWCPSKKITQIQAEKIRNFVKNNGTIIFDLSNDGDISELSVSVSQTKAITYSNYVELNIDNVVIDPNKNGGWRLNDIYEKSNYGIFGSNKVVGSNLTKSFRCFENYSDSYSFIKVGANKTSAKSIGLIFPYASPDATELTRGNIIAVTFPLGQYCNAIFSNDGSDIIFDANISSKDKSQVNTGIYPGVVEGPFKFLFNCVAYAAYCRLSATRHRRANSAVYNYVSPWSTSWVLNQDVLTDSEKNSYFKDIPGVSDQLGIDLIEADSLDTFYKSSLSEVLPDFHKDKIYGLDTSDIEYFIEITNKDVVVSNAEKISISAQTLNDTNIPSSYYLYKILDNNVKPYAYTTSFSNPLLIPERLGAFALIDKPISVSQTKTLNDKLNIFSSFKSYPFKLKTSYSLSSGKETNLYFDASVNVNCNMVFKGKYTRKNTVVTDPTNPITTPTYVNAKVDCEGFTSAIDDNRQRVYSSANPLNTFLYSGDIDIHKDTRLWKSGMSHGYVKYIQYTVSCATGIKIKLDGIYGSQTANAVKVFQTNGKQRYIDGTVDSETKSYMAFWWKNVKKYYSNLYATYLFNAPVEAKQYIIAIENIGTVQDIGSKTYKKLTFTGFGGPNQAKDFIYFKIPDSVKKVNKIIIEADTNPAWRNFVVDLYGYSATNQPDIFKTTNVATNKSAVSGTIEINMNGISADNARYMWFQVVGKSLKGYGYAEGFSIKSIKVDGQIEQIVITPGIPGSTVTTETVEDIWALATVNLSDNYLGINIANPKSVEYSISSFPKINSQITSLAIGCDSTGKLNQGSPFSDGNIYYPTLTSNLSLNLDDYSVGQTEVKFLNNSISFDFTVPPILMSINKATLTDVSQFSRSIIPFPLSVSFSGLTVSVETSAVYYNSTVKTYAVKDFSTNFRLKNLDNRMYPANTNSVDVTDGILLLCDSLGAPIGFPDRSDYGAMLDAASTSDASEYDVRLGTYSISNVSTETNGFIYGFYDVETKEFLGKQLSHIDYLSRGINNVFIAVCAIDADGNTSNRIDYIGPKTTIKLNPVNLPYKMLAPIYSVKMKNSSSIKMRALDPNIYKFDAWELPVTNGSFWKTINISNNRPWADWKQKYSGQDLLAFYSTVDEFNSGWSQIYGYGFYDIVNEKPVLVDDKTIKLRRIPIMNIWYPTSNIDSKAGIIKQNISIYIKENVNSDWIKVSDYNIKEIDSQSGLVKFKNSIVPNDANLIKVSYTTKSKDNMIKQIDGNPLPINPILNIDEIDFDEPLYIYLLPRSIYKTELISYANVFNNLYNKFRVSEYMDSSSVNFTYDSSIFDSKSSKYNPFALVIGIVYVTNNPYKQVPELFDIRVRGGGVIDTISNSELQQSIPEVLSHWDVYPPSGESYTKGGYVIIRIPESVKNNFIDPKEIYQIISNNLTAGVAYELQDMNGNSWN